MPPTPEPRIYSVIDRGSQTLMTNENIYRREALALLDHLQIEDPSKDYRLCFWHSLFGIWSVLEPAMD